MSGQLDVEIFISMWQVAALTRGIPHAAELIHFQASTPHSPVRNSASWKTNKIDIFIQECAGGSKMSMVPVLAPHWTKYLCTGALYFAKAI